nr:response regulator transcription factor [uncultured Dyadobacter sp.]
MKHVLIVDDHSIVRLATLFIIREVIAPVAHWESDNFADALSIVTDHPLDLILLDIHIPGGEGFQMIEKIRSIQPQVLILMFSGVDEEIYAGHYIKAGADGFLSKNASVNEVRNAISTIFERGRYVSKKVRDMQLASSQFEQKKHDNPLGTLSQRELEVMDLMLDGKWTKEIATILSISGSSVSTYKTRIFEKLDVTTIIELYQKVQILRKEREGF